MSVKSVTDALTVGLRAADVGGDDGIAGDVVVVPPLCDGDDRN